MIQGLAGHSQSDVEAAVGGKLGMWLRHCLYLVFPTAFAANKLPIVAAVARWTPAGLKPTAPIIAGWVHDTGPDWTHAAECYSLDGSGGGGGGEAGWALDGLFFGALLAYLLIGLAQNGTAGLRRGELPVWPTHRQLYLNLAGLVKGERNTAFPCASALILPKTDLFACDAAAVLPLPSPAPAHSACDAAACDAAAVKDGLRFSADRGRHRDHLAGQAADAARGGKGGGGSQGGSPKRARKAEKKSGGRDSPGRGGTVSLLGAPL